MNGLNTSLACLLLLLAVTSSALLVVWSTNEVRTLTNRLLELRTQANQMLVAHGQYLLQERSMSSAASLEVIAVEQLGLRYPEEADIKVLKP